MELKGHTMLADYYQYYCKDTFYAQKDLPRHLLEAGLKSRYFQVKMHLLLQIQLKLLK